MKHCLPISYHIVPSVRSKQAKSIYYSTNIWDIYVSSRPWGLRLALSFLLPFQLCDSMGFFSYIVIQLHHEGWVVPDSHYATVQWLRKSSWEIADSGLSPSPKEDTEPRFLLSGLNSGHHLPFFLVKVCAASPSLQTQPSSQGQFQLNLTSCVQKKRQELQLTSTMTAPAQGSSTI